MWQCIVSEVIEHRKEQKNFVRIERDRKQIDDLVSAEPPICAQCHDETPLKTLSKSNAFWNRSNRNWTFSKAHILGDHSFCRNEIVSFLDEPSHGWLPRICSSFMCVLCVVSRISALQVTQKHFIRNLFDLSFSDHFQVDTSILHSNRAASKILCNSLAHFDSYKLLRSYCEFRHCNVTLVSISILFLLSYRNHFWQT